MHAKRLLPTAIGLVGICCVASGCHQAMGRNERALAKAAIVLDASALFDAALVQAARGDSLRAEQYLVAARAEGHDAATVVSWLVRVCASAGRYQSALQHAGGYLRDNPTDWPLRLVVASIHEALGDVGRAQRELEKVVEMQPNHALSRYRLAMLYRSQAQDAPKTLRELLAYLRLEPGGPHAEEVRAALEGITSSKSLGGPDATTAAEVEP